MTCVLVCDLCAGHLSVIQGEVDVPAVSMKYEKVCCCLHCLGGA